MTTRAMRVVIVPVDEYDEMRKQLEFETSWWVGDARKDAIAAAEFERQFEPDRLGEWGHVAWCIHRVIARMRSETANPDSGR